DVEQRGLAGAVGPDDRDEVALGQREVEAAQGDPLVDGVGEEPLGDPGELQHHATPAAAGRRRRACSLRTTLSCGTTRAATTSTAEMSFMSLTSSHPMPSASWMTMR